MKRTNFKLFITTLLILLLAACGGAEDRKAKHIKSGEDFLADKNYEKARLEFKNAAQIDPKDSMARFHIGTVHEAQQNYQSAVKEYVAATQLDENNLKAYIKLGRLYLLGRALERTQETVDKIQSLDPENIHAKVLVSGIKLKNGYSEEAFEIVKQVFAEHSDHFDAGALLSSIYSNKKDYTNAIRVLTDLEQHHPDSVPLRVVKSQLYMQTKQVDKAIKLLQENVRQEQGQIHHVKNLASAYQSTGDLQQAETVLRDNVKNNPDDKDAKLLLVSFVNEEYGFEKAQQTIEQLISESPDAYELKFVLADLFLSVDKEKNAEDIYITVIEDQGNKPFGLLAKSALAKLYFKQKNVDRAINLVNDVLKQNAMDRDAILLKSQYNLSQNNPIDVVADLRTYLQGSPTDTQALKLLAQAHLANNEPTLAEDAYGKVIGVESADIESRSKQAALQLRNGNYAGAIQNYKILIRIEKENSAPYINLINAQLADKAYDDAKSSLKLYEDRFDKPEVINYFKGFLAQTEQNYDLSIEYFHKSLEIQPKAAETVSALKKSYLLARKVDEGIKYFSEFNQVSKDNVFAMNILAELLLAANNQAEAIIVLQDAIELKSEWWLLYRNLAKAEFLQGNIIAAEETLANGIKETNGAEQLNVDLALLYANSEQVDKAIKQYEALIDKGSNSIAVKNNLAMLLVSNHPDDEDQVKRAYELSKDLKKSNHPAYLDTYGWIALKNNDKENALFTLQQANRLSPGSPAINYHLGEAYYAAEQLDKAREHLKKAIGQGLSHEDNRQAKKLLALLEPAK